MLHYRQQLWEQIVAAVQDQYLTLRQDEKNRLKPRLSEIACLQLQLNSFFKAAGGEQHCRDCAGGCCHAGHNHMTLANLLQYISCRQLPPVADFHRSCPFLGDDGCLLPVERRPYNCVTFICDTIEVCLSAADLSEFYRVERRLRHQYLALAQRYEGAAMTGLLLQCGRLQGRSFFHILPAREPRGICHVVEF